jgi:hypothetical protein
MEPGAERFLHAEERAHRRVPDDAVIVAVRFRVGLRAAIFAFPVAPLDLIHQILIVRVDHQGQAGLPDGFETFEQLAVVVETDAGHVRVIPAGVLDHEDLERERTFFGESGNFLGHGAGRIVIEVNDRVFAVMLDQRAVALDVGCRRIHVGHADRKSHTARGRGHGGRRDVFFMGKSRIAVMGMRVDQAGNHLHPFGIDHRRSRVRQHWRLAERRNFAVFDRDIGIDKPARRPNRAVFNQQINSIH